MAVLTAQASAGRPVTSIGAGTYSAVKVLGSISIKCIVALCSRRTISVPPLPDFAVRLLQRSDVPLMRAMMTVFGDAFKEADTYTGAPPSVAYLECLLGDSHLIALAATKHGVVVGGLVAYELQKFEQERTEIYIYDIAVAEAHRRQGIATALIEELKTLAAARNACAIFVQADREDVSAISLYCKLGTRAEVFHFDIGIGPINRT